MTKQRKVVTKNAKDGSHLKKHALSQIRGYRFINLSLKNSNISAHNPRPTRVPTLWYIKNRDLYCVIWKNFLLLSDHTSIIVRPWSFELTDRYPISYRITPLPDLLRIPLTNRILSNSLCFTIYLCTNCADFGLRWPVVIWCSWNNRWWTGFCELTFGFITFWFSVPVWLREAGALCWEIHKQ